MNENNRGFKILFYISFIPVILIMCEAIYAYWKGITFFFSYIYGFDAVFTSLLVGLINYTFRIPILPVCFIYQILYILKKKGKALKNVNIKKLAIIFVILVLIINVLIFLPDLKDSIEEKIQYNKATSMIENSEVTIVYNESEFYSSGLFNIEGYVHSYIFIDYDNMKLGILFSPSSSGEYYEAKFNSTSKESDVLKNIQEKYYVQIDKLLDDGSRLVSFYKEENHRTIAFVLIKNNKYYYIDNIYEKNTNYPKYFGLNRSNDLVKKETKFEY